MSTKKIETNAGTPESTGVPFEQATKIARADGTEISLDQVKSATLDALKKAPLVPVIFPVSPSGHKYVDIGLNGLIYRIERGKQVKVPEPILQVWNQSLQIEERNASYAERFMQQAS
jgi:hypothetical protein